MNASTERVDPALAAGCRVPLAGYRAAWLRDQGNTVTREAAMAKMAATEVQQLIIARELLKEVRA